MYDALTARYTFSCPERGEARVSLSSFRRVGRLPGPAHPVVFEVEFGCACGIYCATWYLVPTGLTKDLRLRKYPFWMAS